MRDTEDRNSVKCNNDKILKMIEVKTAKIRENKKFELMLMRRAKAYSSSCSQVIVVYLHPFRRSSLFCS